jgi:two-component system, chemotaxis family, chemotaxis protein CheY
MTESAMTRVVLVGHCGADSGMLRSAVQRALPECEVTHVDRAKDLENKADGSSLLLVNRVLPGGLGESSGIDLIRRLQERDAPHRPAAMLISNYEDAQRQAEAAGALPGFGKAELGQPETVEKLRRATRTLSKP